MYEIIYGNYSIKSLLKYDYKKIIKIFLVKKFLNNKYIIFYNKLIKLNISVKFKSLKWFNKKLHKAIHQGIIAYIKNNLFYKEKDIIKLFLYQKLPIILILDGILDSNNLGSCLRSSDAAGVNFVILPYNNTVKLNCFSKKISCGASESIPLIYIINLSRILNLLIKYNIYIVGATLKSKYSLYKMNFNKSIALVIGSENKGIRYLTYRYCNKFIYIPMMGFIKSLNLSIATSVCLFEILRQRKILLYI